MLTIKIVSKTDRYQRQTDHHLDATAKLRLSHMMERYRSINASSFHGSCRILKSAVVSQSCSSKSPTTTKLSLNVMTSPDVVVPLSAPGRLSKRRLSLANLLPSRFVKEISCPTLNGNSTAENNSTSRLTDSCSSTSSAASVSTKEDLLELQDESVADDRHHQTSSSHSRLSSVEKSHHSRRRHHHHHHYDDSEAPVTAVSSTPTTSLAVHSRSNNSISNSNSIPSSPRRQLGMQPTFAGDGIMKQPRLPLGGNIPIASPIAKSYKAAPLPAQCPIPRRPTTTTTSTEQQKSPPRTERQRRRRVNRAEPIASP